MRQSLAGMHTYSLRTALLLVVITCELNRKTIVYLDHVHRVDEHPRRDSAGASDAEAHGRRDPLGGTIRRFGSHG